MQVALKDRAEGNSCRGQNYKQCIWLAISPEGEMARDTDLGRANILSPRTWQVENGVSLAHEGPLRVSG